VLCLFCCCLGYSDGINKDAYNKDGFEAAYVNAVLQSFDTVETLRQWVESSTLLDGKALWSRVKNFTLTDAACEGFDTNTKMNPPLRSREHLDAILKAIADGTVDAIATDHAPHHSDEKELEFDRAAFGITGLETAVGLAFDRLVNGGLITLERLIELFSVNPARIFRLEGRGTLRPGAHGDVTILDPDLRWTFDASRSKSKSRNTPFDGYTLHGAAVATVVAGRVVYRREEALTAKS